MHQKKETVQVDVEIFSNPDRNVVLEFSHPIERLTFYPQDAITFSRALIEASSRLLGGSLLNPHPANRALMEASSRLLGGSLSEPQPANEG